MVLFLEWCADLKSLFLSASFWNNFVLLSILIQLCKLLTYFCWISVGDADGYDLDRYFWLASFNIILCFVILSVNVNVFS